MKEITLTKGYIAWVDDEDYEVLSYYKWHALDSHPVHIYAAKWLLRVPGFPRVALRMHHAVLGIIGSELNKRNLLVDHIDRNSLNNQKYNLRIATRSVNAYNSNRSDNALGIYFDNCRGQFKAVDLGPPKKFIGWFHTLEQALEAKQI